MEANSTFRLMSSVGALNHKPVLDLCLLRLQPVLRTEVIKKYKLTMTRKVLDMNFNDRQTDLKTLTATQRSSLIDEIGLLPSWFDRQEYINKYWQKITVFLSQHSELKEKIDELNKMQNATAERKAGIFEPLLTKLYDITINTATDWHNANMAEFLQSTLPFELYDMYNVSFMNRINTLKAVKEIIKNFKTNLHFHRSDDKKLDNDIKYFKAQTEDLVAARIGSSDAEDLLKFYIKIKNSNSVDELFEMTPLKMEKLDRDKFNKYFDQYVNATNNLSKILREYLHHVDLPSVSYPESQSIREFERDVGQLLLNYG